MAMLRKSLNKADELKWRSFVVAVDGLQSGVMLWEEAEKAAMAVRFFLSFSAVWTEDKEFVVVTAPTQDAARLQKHLTLIRNTTAPNKDILVTPRSENKLKANINTGPEVTPDHPKETEPSTRPSSLFTSGSKAAHGAKV